MGSTKLNKQIFILFYLFYFLFLFIYFSYHSSHTLENYQKGLKCFSATNAKTTNDMQILGLLTKEEKRASTEKWFNHF